ncbi:hypothetical protein KY290_011227 [Solanum tuberosum]|uniref:Uncharacterized protein n=1 Tax=Solanum tuberosum TaxID=4113 RepID=A0ABQ7W239_SOLTU|nr:hypothetical protein KY290_011227 [Solanum tuberosum]
MENIPYVSTAGSLMYAMCNNQLEHRGKICCCNRNMFEMVWLIKELGQDKGWNAGCIVTTKCHSFGEELYISFKDETH